MTRRSSAVPRPGGSTRTTPTTSGREARPSIRRSGSDRFLAVGCIRQRHRASSRARATAAAVTDSGVARGDRASRSAPWRRSRRASARRSLARRAACQSIPPAARERARPPRGDRDDVAAQDPSGSSSSISSRRCSRCATTTPNAACGWLSTRRKRSAASPSSSSRCGPTSSSSTLLPGGLRSGTSVPPMEQDLAASSSRREGGLRREGSRRHDPRGARRNRSVAARAHAVDLFEAAARCWMTIDRYRRSAASRALANAPRRLRTHAGAAGGCLTGAHAPDRTGRRRGHAAGLRHPSCCPRRIPDVERRSANWWTRACS